MLKKLWLVCILFPVFFYGQYKVSGTLTAGTDTYEWIILYQLKGGSQQYVLNTNITDGNFSFDMPADAKQGVYRISYDNKNSGFIDVLFNYEDIVLRFDPFDPLGTADFTISQENILFQEYFLQGALKEATLDSIQYTAFTQGTGDPARQAAYKQHLAEYEALQQRFETESVNTLAYHFIKAEKKFYAPELITTPQEYLNSVKAHYFDNLDLISPELHNSSLISERIIDYVFYLNSSDDAEVQQQLFKYAVDEVMALFKGHEPEKKEVLITLLHAFTQMENLELVEYLIENQHDKLPEVLKEPNLIDELNHQLRLAIGRKAPNFDLSYKGRAATLHTIDGANYYVIVFWSSTCPHCIEEMPKLYEHFKSNEQVEIIAIALESDELSHATYTAQWKGWSHILGLGKWNNALARLFEVNTTPNYFLLDADKKIIAKPEFFEDLQWLFQN